MLDKETESIVGIDSLNLDRECIRLPTSYLRAAHRAAEAKRDVAEAEAQLSVVEADLSKDIRANPADYDVEKVTEGSIKGIVITRKAYKVALAAVLAARYACDLAQAVVWALEHKKRSLTLLVELHGMSYFSNPKVSAAGKEAVEQMTQRKVRRGRDEE